MHKPPQKWLEDAHNGHTPETWEEDPELHNALFPHNGNLWGMTNTPDHAFQKVIFNKQRQFGYQVPATPYGLVAFVPAQTNLDDVANVTDWWHTDGIYIWKERGERLTGKEAARALEEDFSEAANKLPFRQVHDAVFMQIIRMKNNHYRLVLVDNGWINPKEREINIKVQMEGNFTAVNALDKSGYEISGDHFKVPVPAGLFTIVDVKRID